MAAENVKTFVGTTVNAVRLCFYADRYQTSYMEIDGTWRASTVDTSKVIEPPAGP